MKKFVLLFSVFIVLLCACSSQGDGVRYNDVSNPPDQSNINDQNEQPSSANETQCDDCEDRDSEPDENVAYPSPIVIESLDHACNENTIYPYVFCDGGSSSNQIDISLLDTEYYSHPLHLAQHGLDLIRDCYDYKIIPITSCESSILKIADYFVRVGNISEYQSRPFKSYPYSAEYEWVGYSGFANAIVASFLAQAWQVFGNSDYADHAKYAIEIINVPLSQGGAKSDINGDIWFEVDCAP